MFTQQEKTWTSERLDYAGSDKGTYYTHTESGIGHLSQLDDRVSDLNNIQIGEGYKLIIDGNKDIMPTDKIIIDSTSYEVRGVKHNEMGSINIKELLLIKKKT